MSMIARTANALKSACANSTLSLQRRHGSGGVNAWEKPTDPASWKGEHTVIVVLSGWAMVIYGASQVLGKKKNVAAAESPAVESSATPATEKMVAKAESAATEVKETASKAASKTASAATEAKETVSETASKAASNTASAASEAKETASKNVSAAIDSVQKSIDAVAGEGK